MDFFHGLQVAIMLAVMTNVLQFAHWTVSRKRKGMPHCVKFRPVYILVVATLLVMVQPTCMLVIGSWASLPNFFFNGGDTNKVCSADYTMCSHGCMSNVFDCSGVPTVSDPLFGAASAGACEQLTCEVAQKRNGTIGAAGLPCQCSMDSNALQPNTAVGLWIQFGCTYLGFLLLFIGVFQATELHVKMCKRWRELRPPSGTARQPEPECAT